MKSREDFRRAVGCADEAFSDAIRRTLAQLRQQEEEKPVKKISTGFVIAIALLLAAAAALAAASQWGILDFLGRYEGGSAMLPEASQIIQTDVAQEGGASKNANFTLREAACDGNEVYLVVEATPTSDDLLLIGPDVGPDDRIVNLIPTIGQEDLTIAQYSKQLGKSRLARVNIADEAVFQGLEGVVNSLEYVLEEDGTLVLMAHGSCGAEAELPIRLFCMATVVASDEERLLANEAADAGLTATLSFTLRPSVGHGGVRSLQSAAYTDCGVNVTEVILTATPIATYVSVSYTVTDPERYAQTDDGLWFEFLDVNGDSLPGGGTGSGSVSPVDDSGTRFVQTESITAMEALPETVTLRGYNCWTKERYETHTFDMQ